MPNDSGAVSSRPGFIERGIAAAYRARSLESRAGSVLSLAVVCVLGVGLLAWYYGMALQRPAHAAEQARANAASRAQAEMPLPPLLIPPPAPPKPSSTSVGASATASPTASTPPSSMPDANAATGVGMVPMSTPPWLTAYLPSSSAPVALSASRIAASSPGANPRRGALERRLAGPTFVARTRSTAAGEDNASSASAMGTEDSRGPGESGIDPDSPHAAGSIPVSEGAAAPGELTKLLLPVVTPAVAAQVLPTRTLLLPKGAFIDCTLETAIDSTLPGMTTCITATDTFGADGQVVLLERGSKLVGETRGEVAQASSRVFVLWTEARTPTGVVIPLASPGTDELGRSGLPGTVNRHFFERFGAALLISVIDAGAQAAAAQRSGAVIYSPTTSQDVMSEVLKDTLRIPPTIVKSQGDRIQVLVARDLDFRSVYELRPQNSER